MGTEALIEELVAEINRLKKIIPNVYDDELYDAAKKIVENMDTIICLRANQE